LTAALTVDNLRCVNCWRTLNLALYTALSLRWLPSL